MANLSLRALAPFMLAAALASGAAAQHVLTVDDDPGAAQFQSIALALTNAAVGDRIEVAPGSYSGFTVWRGVTVMGADPASVHVGGEVTVNFVPQGQTVVLADFRLDGPADGVTVRDCDGSVLFDRVGAGHLELLRAEDARLQRCTFRDGVFVRFSRAQFVSSLLEGAPGDSFSLDGERALLVQHSRVAVTGSAVRGGDGTPALPPLFQGGDGGDAIQVLGPTSRLWLLDSTAVGGSADVGSSGGSGLVVSNGEAVTARSTVAGALAGPPPAVIRDAPDFPSLELLGIDPTPGNAVTFECIAAAGDSARIYAGREPRVDPTPLSLPWFHSRERGAALGSLPANGTALVPFTVPALPRGTLVFGQFSRVTPTGDTELSNSVTLLVR